MKISAKLQLVIVFASVLPIAIIVLTHGRLDDSAFNSAVALGGVFALLTGFLVTQPLKGWIYQNQIREIKNFCAHVKTGHYEQRMRLPNQRHSSNEENELLDLMRELDWMAHRIKKREEELRDSVVRLDLATLQVNLHSEKHHRLHNLLNRFLAPEMVTQLLNSPNHQSLNKRAMVTILFSDIRGFTTLSEQLTPEAVVSLLNPYLEAMTRVILANGGTVDKYEGDAIIAFFGEPIVCPDHALRAARTAVGMRLELEKLNKAWLATGRLAKALEIGIGIHSGEVFVGLLGSDQRISYTVIGDNVNLTSRLQDQTKELGWPILLSEASAQQIGSEFGTEKVGAATFRGKSQAITIYKLTSYRRPLQSSTPYCSDESTPGPSDAVGIPADPTQYLNAN